ncbi:MAG: CpsD/CapB family tyrosine-protein kinase [Vicinamibacteria bacterium]
MSEIFKAITKAGLGLGELTREEPRLPMLDDEGPPELPRFDERTESVERIKDRALRVVLKPETVFAEQLRVIRTKVHTLSQTAPFECFGVVSASEGEGKTTVAVGLAAALASESTERVLLIEANLRRPVLEKRLGLEPAAGLTEWLRGNVDTVILSRLEPLGFTLLRAGGVAEKPSDLLTGTRMGELMQRCRDRYDHVILDCNALTPVADAVVLQEQVDGYLLVVRSRFAARDTVQRSLTHLKRGTVKGVVFNAHRRLLR